MKKLALYILPTILCVFMAAFFVQGQASPEPTGMITNVSQILNIVRYVVTLVYWLFFLIAILFIILAAFNYLTAGGDPLKVKKASNQLIYAVVAVAVALIAWGITSIVQNALQQGQGG
jgi:ACR3 family arsenite efflux pump ArsB